jgi:hypothetical protein
VDKITQPEIWKRELSGRLAKPLLKRIIRARLDGKAKLNTASIARSMPALRSKRRSIQCEVVGLTISQLRNERRLPDGMELA